VKHKEAVRCRLFCGVDGGRRETASCVSSRRANGRHGETEKLTIFGRADGNEVGKGRRVGKVRR